VIASPSGPTTAVGRNFWFSSIVSGLVPVSVQAPLVLTIIPPNAVKYSLRRACAYRALATVQRVSGLCCEIRKRANCQAQADRNAVVD
jgi:hypothetical protein